MIDARRDARAASTCTNGEGSGVVVPGTGMHLNNVMGEEDLNPFGFHRHPPGRRMPSMMAPSIVMRDGEVELVLGSAGLQPHPLGAAADDRRRGRPRPRRDARRSRRRGCTSRTASSYAEPGIDLAELPDEPSRRALRRAATCSSAASRPRAVASGALSGAGDPRRGGVGGERMRRAAPIACARAAIARALLAGCGGIEAPDLFIVNAAVAARAREADAARQRRRGRDCNGGARAEAERSAARRGARDPGRTARTGRATPALAPRPGLGARATSVRDENGTVTFSRQLARPAEGAAPAALFVLQAAQQVCHLPE